MENICHRRDHHRGNFISRRYCYGENRYDCCIDILCGFQRENFGDFKLDVALQLAVAAAAHSTFSSEISLQEISRRDHVLPLSKYFGYHNHPVRVDGFNILQRQPHSGERYSLPHVVQCGR